MGLVINRFKGEDKPITESAAKWSLDIFGRIPEDQNITDYDASGKPIFNLPGTSPSVVAVGEMLKKLGFISR